jgi:hypothetical protein
LDWRFWSASKQKESKGKETTYGKVSAVQSLGEHPGIPEVLVRDLLVSIKAQIEEVEHLGYDRSSGLGKVPKSHHQR